MTRGWFGEQFEGGHCDPLCPFVRDCPSCAFRGGDSSVAQQDSARETGQEMGASCRIGDTTETPATASTVRGRGPTDSTGRTQPMVPTYPPTCQTNRENGSVR